LRFLLKKSDSNRSAIAVTSSLDEVKIPVQEMARV
jgi:hypothetical protein